MVAGAGGSERLEAIIRRHHETPLSRTTELDDLLAVLQAADGSH